MAEKEKKTVSAGTTVNKQANQFKDESTIYLTSLREQLVRIQDTDSQEIKDMIGAINDELNARNMQRHTEEVQQKIKQAQEAAREQEKNLIPTVKKLEAAREQEKVKEKEKATVAAKPVEEKDCQLIQQIQKEREYQKDIQRAHEELDITQPQTEQLVGKYFKQVFDTFSVFYYVYGQLYDQLQVRKVYLSKDTNYIENTTSDVQRFTKLAQPATQEEFNNAQAEAFVNVQRARKTSESLLKNMFGNFHTIMPFGFFI